MIFSNLCFSAKFLYIPVKMVILFTDPMELGCSIQSLGKGSKTKQKQKQKIGESVTFSALGGGALGGHTP